MADAQSQCSGIRFLIFAVSLLAHVSLCNSFKLISSRFTSHATRRAISTCAAPIKASSSLSSSIQAKALPADEEISGVLVKHVLLRVSDTVSLHITEAGTDGSPVCCLLHGFPDFWLTWRFQIPALVEAGYRVVCPDLRGYGLSSKPDGAWSYSQRDIVDDVDAIRRQYCGEGAFALLAGHDWGAGVAWSAMLEKGNCMAQKLAILALPHPKSWLHGIKNLPEQQIKSWYIAAFQLPYLPEALILAGGAPLLKRTFENCSPPLEPATYQLHMDACFVPFAMRSGMNWYRASGCGLWPSFTAGGGLDTAHALSRVMSGVSQDEVDRCMVGCAAGDRVLDVPVLSIFGVNDKYISRSLGMPPSNLVPNCQYVELDAGHWVHWEASKSVNEEIVRFLQ